MTKKEKDKINDKKLISYIINQYNNLLKNYKLMIDERYIENPKLFIEDYKDKIIEYGLKDKLTFEQIFKIYEIFDLSEKRILNSPKDSFIILVLSLEILIKDCNYSEQFKEYFKNYKLISLEEVYGKKAFNKIDKSYRQAIHEDKFSVLINNSKYKINVEFSYHFKEERKDQRYITYIDLVLIFQLMPIKLLNKFKNGEKILLSNLDTNFIIVVTNKSLIGCTFKIITVIKKSIEELFVRDIDLEILVSEENGHYSYRYIRKKE